MPTYDYVCEACAHRFERVQSMTEDPIRVCPECGEEQVVKVFGVPAITFKGSGFYKTDSRSGNGKSKGKSDAKSSETKSSDAKSSESKSESSSSSTSDSSSSSTKGKGSSSSSGSEKAAS
jgi:putative FmdB family regulatory protein